MTKTMRCKCRINEETFTTTQSLWKKDGSLIGYNDTGDVISIHISPDEIDLQITTSKDIFASNEEC